MELVLLMEHLIPPVPSQLPTPLPTITTAPLFRCSMCAGFLLQGLCNSYNSPMKQEQLPPSALGIQGNRGLGRVSNLS